jgi:hypothetical protein
MEGNDFNPNRYRFRNYISGNHLRHSFINDVYELSDGTIYLALNDSSLTIMHHLLGVG